MSAGKYKDAIELTGLSTLEESVLKNNRGKFSGIHGDRLLEPLPNFFSLPCESVIKGENNTYIVLGRDRPGNKRSGYGGRGDTQAGSIDIVVGRASWLDKGEDVDGNKIWVDPNFEYDAARVYISQKTDIDLNLGLAEGSGNSVAKSGIGIKADSVRIVSRENIKLVTGVDTVNAQGGKSVGRYGIDLMANNDDKGLQPLVKGNNLVECLNEINDAIDALSGAVEAILRTQTQINTVLAGHVHVSFGTPSPELAIATIASMIQAQTEAYSSIVVGKVNSAMRKINYLTAMSEKYINSTQNRTN